MPTMGSIVTARIEECGEPTPIPEDIRQAAARIVCGNAHDAEDARQLLYALGLMPGQENEDYRTGPAGAESGLA
jgi:hypothetical protein